jgi:hypothetical protein
MYIFIASYPGHPMFFNVACEKGGTLKNMGWPGYEATYLCVHKVRIVIDLVTLAQVRGRHCTCTCTCIVALYMYNINIHVHAKKYDRSMKVKL